MAKNNCSNCGPDQWEEQVPDKPVDIPIDELIPMMEQQVQAGNLVFFKFTCDHCGDRQTDEEPNRICKGGYSCEACGGVTYPTHGGFMLVASNRMDEFLKIFDQVKNKNK